MYAEWAMKIRHTVHINDIDTKGHWLSEKDPEAARLRWASSIHILTFVT
jgi:hypothetical protein